MNLSQVLHQRCLCFALEAWRYYYYLGIWKLRKKNNILPNVISLFHHCCLTIAVGRRKKIKDELVCRWVSAMAAWNYSQPSCSHWNGAEENVLRKLSKIRTKPPRERTENCLSNSLKSFKQCRSVDRKKYTEEEKGEYKDQEKLSKVKGNPSDTSRQVFVTEILQQRKKCWQSLENV